MRFTHLILSIVLGAATFAPAAAASTLLLNGSQSVQSAMGDPLVISFSGTPLQPDFLLIDVFPGPTQLFGQSVPLGFSPFLSVLSLGVVPPGGSLVIPTVTPVLPGIDSVTVYLLGAVADASAPGGVDFSNGATLTIVKPPSAGPPRSAIVGHEVLLNTTGIADKHGLKMPGTSVVWSMVQKPGSSLATIQNPSQPYATLTPDEPGDYALQATLTKNGVSTLSTTVVHAWRVTVPGLGNGGIVSSPSSFQLLIEGPNDFSLVLDGQNVPSAGAGTYGPFPMTFPIGKIAKKHVVELIHDDGSKVATNPVFFLGKSTPIGSGAAKGMATNVTQSGVDLVAAVLAPGITQAQVKSFLVGQPAIVLVDQPGPLGTTLFSATADVLDVAFTQPVGLALTTKSSGLGTTVTLHNFAATVKVSGKIANVPYSVTGTASANPVTYMGTCTLTPSGSTLSAAMSAQSIALSNFALSLPGFPGVSSQLSTIANAFKSWVSPLLQSVLSSQVAQVVKSGFAKIAATAPIQTVAGAGVSAQSTFAAVQHAAGALAFQLNSLYSAVTSKPGTPAIGQYLGSGSTPPTFPATGPSGVPYQFASSMADDFLNAALAIGTKAGLLEGKAVDLLAGVGQVFTLTAGQLAAMFPNAGFEQFDPGVTVTATLHGTVAPITIATPAGPGDVQVQLVAAELTLLATTAYGDVPMASFSMDATLDLDLAIDGDGTLNASLVAISIDLDPIAAFPGVDPGTFPAPGQLLKDEVAKLARLIKDYASELRPPTLQALGLALVGVTKDFLGSLGNYWTQFGNLF